MSITIDKLRQYRIAEMAIFDWITSLLGAIVIGYYILKLKGINNWIIWIIIWIFIGIGIHLLLGVDTMFGYYLGLNKKPIHI